MADELSIYTPTGTLLYSIGGYSASDVHDKELMTTDAITLSFTSPSVLRMVEGCYITYGGENYYLTEPCRPTYDTATGGYVYKPQFVAGYMRMKSHIAQYGIYYYLGVARYSDRGELDFDLTDRLEGHIKLVMDNIEAAKMIYGKDGKRDVHYTYEIHADDIPSADEYKLVSYQHISIFDALNEVCETFDCEWWFEGAVMHIGYCSTGGDAVELEARKHFITSTANRTSQAYANRYYVVGSSENIPSGYRTDDDVTKAANIQRRLLLPKNIKHSFIDIEADFDAGKYQISSKPYVVDALLQYDDIKPGHVSTVGLVLTTTGTLTNESTGQQTQHVVYLVNDTDEIGTTAGDVPAGETLKAKFQTGDLAGMTFDVKMHDNYVDGGENTGDEETDSNEATGTAYGRMYELIWNIEGNTVFPNDNIRPKEGDQYVLYNMVAKLPEVEYYGEERTIDNLWNTSLALILPTPDDTSAFAGFTARSGWQQCIVFSSGLLSGTILLAETLDYGDDRLAGVRLEGMSDPGGRIVRIYHTTPPTSTATLGDIAVGDTYRLLWSRGSGSLPTYFWLGLIKEAEEKLLTRALDDIKRWKSYSHIESVTLDMNPVAVAGYRPVVSVLATSALGEPDRKSSVICTSETDGSTPAIATQDTTPERWYPTDGAEIEMEVGGNVTITDETLADIPFITRVTGYSKRLDGSCQDKYTCGIRTPQSRLKQVENKINKLAYGR